jgi:hypothetical protein
VHRSSLCCASNSFLIILLMVKAAAAVHSISARGVRPRQRVLQLTRLRLLPAREGGKRVPGQGPVHTGRLGQRKGACRCSTVQLPHWQLWVLLLCKQLAVGPQRGLLVGCHCGDIAASVACDAVARRHTMLWLLLDVGVAADGCRVLLWRHRAPAHNISSSTHLTPQT